MENKNTDLIIFDLGRVLIDFDFRRVIRRLRLHSALSEKQIHDFFIGTPLWDAFERGRFSPEVFFKELSRELGLKKIDFAAFTEVWNNIFTEKHDTVALLRQLKNHYRTAILSNVNEMHWMHVKRRHSFIEWFDYPVASYAVGLRKPEAAIFRYILQLAGVAPCRAVFIDDLETHVLAARSLGIRAYQFINARQLQSDIEDLL